jgi:hypothetical protein
MTLVLDAGAFLSVERSERDTVALLKNELVQGRVPVTHGGIVGQVWRGGSGRGAPIARLLAGVEVAVLDDALGRRAGELLRDSATSDVLDAALVLQAFDGDTILTSDPDHITILAEAAGLHVDIVEV